MSTFPTSLYVFDVQTVRTQATFENAIAVDKKCCWCCDRLGTLLGDVKLPGSHGVLYSWRPPRVGVDVAVLRSFESILWNEMKAANRLFPVFVLAQTWLEGESLHLFGRVWITFLDDLELWTFL